MGAKLTKYADTSFFWLGYFIHIFLFFYVTHLVVAPPGATKSGMKGYKNKAAVYAYEDSGATLT